ncbi:MULTISPECIES: hypothetical protein [Streptomyces]|uniref:Lipoprotein n=1 Tax=Streptomyces spororaveus TaxID=284039 RepID=A0ABQ3TP91_9ACTN|nr:MULTISPECIES: hypothetical protein [Streptomyces]MCM9077532.1 hypothetical protein [Streptomyces spororaveus]MCX5307989.1 hypothetical protein [Streptomyces sp. NBC_00160]GHI82132.1 hypothetical protein Sspor_76930 [Streptomyces spororaveus]
MLTNRLLRAAVPMAVTALALTACGPEDDAGPAATQKGTFTEPLALKTSADVSETHFPDNAKTQLSVTPVSVVKGDKAAVEKLGVGLLEGKTPYYVTTTYAHKGGAPDTGSFNFKLLLHGTDQQRAYFFAPAWGAKFEPCQEVAESELPLAAGKSVTTCEIYLVPENVQPLFVGFQGDRDNRSPSHETGSAAEVVWKVG